MKHLILLLLIALTLPSVCISQNILPDLNSPENVNKVFQIITDGEHCEKDKADLFRINGELTTSLLAKTDEISDLNSQLRTANEKHTDAAVDLQKARDKKPFSFAVHAGSDVYGKFHFTAGLSYSIFRF